MFRRTKLAAALFGMAAFQARGASLSDLIRQIPAPPADVPTAVAWVKDGQVVAPEVVRFKAALDAERQAIIALNGGTMPVLTDPPPAVTGDTPVVEATAKAYADYFAAYSGAQEPKAVLVKRERWLQVSIGNRLVDVADKMTPCPTNPCTDPAIVAKNQPLLAKRAGIGREDIKYWNVLFEDYRQGREPIVDEAQVRIAATGTGAQATTPAGRSLIARYRAAMLHEIEVALSVTETTVRRAWAIDTGQVDAVSSGTRSPKNKTPVPSAPPPAAPAGGSTTS